MGRSWRARVALPGVSVLAGVRGARALGRAGQPHRLRREGEEVERGALHLVYLQWLQRLSRALRRRALVRKGAGHRFGSEASSPRAANGCCAACRPGAARGAGGASASNSGTRRKISLIRSTSAPLRPAPSWRRARNGESVHKSAVCRRMREKPAASQRANNAQPLCVTAQRGKQCTCRVPRSDWYIFSLHAKVTVSRVSLSDRRSKPGNHRERLTQCPAPPSTQPLAYSTRVSIRKRSAAVFSSLFLRTHGD